MNSDETRIALLEQQDQHLQTLAHEIKTAMASVTQARNADSIVINEMKLENHKMLHQIKVLEAQVLALTEEMAKLRVDIVENTMQRVFVRWAIAIFTGTVAVAASAFGILKFFVK